MAVPRPSLEEIRAAAERLPDGVIRTPLVRLNADGPETYLKLENLQPIGSFKVRGACNAIATADPEALERGVYTCSAGNMAQGLAWAARRIGVECSVVVPDHAPQNKLEAIERLGGRTVQVSFDDWWRVMVEHRFAELEGVFIHPVSEPAVIAGNGTTGLEILEDLPQVATIVVPFGGGGLSCGIAAAVKSSRPEIRVIAAEVSTAAPLSAAIAAGSPRQVDYQPSFVDGIGAKGLLEEMWPLVKELVDDAIATSPAQIAAAVRLLIERNRVVAEGAGAASLAALQAVDGLDEPIVCVISGGNIDASKLVAILSGRVPAPPGRGAALPRPERTYR